MSAPSGSDLVAAAPWVRMHLDGDGVVLVSAQRAVHYEGRAAGLIAKVIPLLDGRRDAAAIASDLGDAQLAAAIAKLCDRLVADQMATRTDGTSEATNADPVLARLPGGSSAATQQTLYVVGDARQHEAVAHAAPAAWEVRQAKTLRELMTRSPPADAVLLVWIDDINDVEVTAWNTYAWRRRLTWLPVMNFDGHVALIGPLIVAPQTACYQCFLHRRAASSGLNQRYFDLRLVNASPQSASLTAFLAAAATLNLADWTIRSDPFAPGALHAVTFDRGVRTEVEYVLKVPRCPACRPVSARLRSAVWSRYPESDSAGADDA